MSRHLLYFLLIITAFSSCKKSDDFVFDQSPDERINETLAKYNDVLTGAEHGWRGLVYPSLLDGTAYSFYFRFDKENRVEMFSDFDSASNVTVKESSFRLKSLQQPCLLFDTYSYLHVLCDPDAGVNNGLYGLGLGSDFEFSIDGIYGDSIKLTGRLHGSKAVLVKATSQEAQDYYESKRNREFDNISRFLIYFKQLTTGSTKYDVYVNQFYRQLTLVRPDAGEGTRKFVTNYYFTSNGIAFSPAIDDGGQIIQSFDNVSWNEGSQLMHLKINDKDALISSIANPLVVDTTAGKRWWDIAFNDGAYWRSYYGFHIDGVDDAYNMRGLAGYVSMIYYPSYGSGFDWMGVLASTNYGPAFGPKFNTNGKVTFTSPGNFGAVPPEAQATIANVRSKFTESTGFYFVQTSAQSFDMVSAADARIWITWQ